MQFSIDGRCSDILKKKSSANNACSDLSPSDVISDHLELVNTNCCFPFWYLEPTNHDLPQRHQSS